MKKTEITDETVHYLPLGYLRNNDTSRDFVLVLPLHNILARKIEIIS